MAEAAAEAAKESAALAERAKAAEDELDTTAARIREEERAETARQVDEAVAEARAGWEEVLRGEREGLRAAEEMLDAGASHHDASDLSVAVRC